MTKSILAPLGVAIAVCLLTPADAAACGCFTPPDVSHPVIQAGERILFTAQSGQITAFIQIQYAGQADQFGWLLPLPSVPTLEVGADEMFVQLQARTDPVFSLRTNGTCSSGFCLLAGGASASPAFDGTLDLGSGPTVVVDSIGPYDFAVLKADDQTAMLDWLKNNNYFVPAGTAQSVTPYIHPGAYFLALKLKAGKSAGDIQPVVVHYASDLPMIPIILTSVGAVPHMGILVWVLGPSRAIPRNYFHTVLDDAALDWTSGSNYNDLLIRAVGEAPNHHTFITEFAGTSGVMTGAITVPAVEASYLMGLTDPLEYVLRLKRALLPYPFTGPLAAILAAHIAEPPELIAEGVSAADFYSEPDVWIDSWRQRYPNATPIPFDPKATTIEVAQRVLDPLKKADQVFRDFRYLTRLHTALSPEDMNSDPVFSFNDSLPDVSNQWAAQMNVDCNGDGQVQIVEGLVIKYPASKPPANLGKLPASLRIEMTRETGAPIVKTDNTANIKSLSGVPQSGGCKVSPSRTPSGIVLLLLFAAGALLLRRIAEKLA